ncbi:hypothetical protein PGB90_002383 [Kerria lacca]
MENSDCENSDVFKKPSFLPEKSQTKSKQDIDVEEILCEKCEDEYEIKKEDITVKLKETVELAKPSQTKTPTQPIPYQEPSWGGQPDVFYSIEEMKSGVSLRMIPLDQKSFYSFGRLENCHIVMAHPTISRYHAILQFRSTFSDNDDRKGFYLFDLGSTHGTFLNKERIVPRTYVKVQVGHIIKFGSSTRFFLLHGPDDDQEEESKLTYTQLRNLRKEELEKRQNEYLLNRAKLCGEVAEEESKGIDWGMGEDADEETDLTENPFAMTTNEEMYINDPKKVLRCWFEREGEEINYQIEEKGYGQFRCSVELPIENSTGGCIVAEAVVSGKKKEATYQCALEACRILDRNGLLKKTTQESRKRKLKNWEDDDYYDSDEDNFFDRTGDLEIKRKQRMSQIKKTQPVTDTYETLIQKHMSVLKEIEEIERKLSNMLTAASAVSTEDEENIDSFMSNKNSGQIIDKLELRKQKSILNNLKKDEEHLRKLINFVKPFELPGKKPSPITQIENYEKIKQEETQNELIHKKYAVETNKKEADAFEEKEILPKKTLSDKKTDNVKSVSEEKLINYQNSDDISSISEKNLMKIKNIKKSKEIAKCFSNQYEEDFNNIVWTPPSNQTGDGRTKLNDKLGY